MRILLDTHIVIWLVTDPTRLRPGEHALIQRHRAEVCVSVVSLWEIRMKWDTFDRNGRRKGQLEPGAAADLIDSAGFAIVPFTRDVVIAPLATPIDHLDPFDRILLVQAQLLDARLLTRDGQLQAHPIALGV